MVESIDDHFKKSDEKFLIMKKTVKAGFIGAGVGLVAGAIPGIYVGESINDYVEVFKQAPAAIQYAVDLASATLVGGIGAAIGGSLAMIPGMYKHWKNF